MSSQAASEASGVELHVANRYKLVKKIGSGSFGDIYYGVSLHSGKNVAIKLEALKAKYPQLYYESKLYKMLSGSDGVPKVKWAGKEGDFFVLVMELLGPSLEDCFNFCNRKFSLRTVLLLADQMLDRIRLLHSKNFIHRDIKPDNFLLGAGSRCNQIYIIDFGLAKRYRDPASGAHIPYREDKSLTGTARYASINAHAGREQSRRDDLEALGYVLLYFVLGELPWQGLKAASKKQKYEKIMEKKISTDIPTLCSKLPDVFVKYIQYARNLQFEEAPDYEHLKAMFTSVYVAKRYERATVFDWSMLSANPASVVTSTTSSKKTVGKGVAQ
eukprot:m.202066 g.202066  ORF g.202066 m.202066 type:complete len:329 (-) comp14976_c0_seq14:3589-4575(-)